jgi:hypothetical protein
MAGRIAAMISLSGISAVLASPKRVHVSLLDFGEPSLLSKPHVGKRLAEAMRTLRHLPMNGHPKAFGNSWPEYEIEWTDELAQAGADAIQRAQDEAARNRTKVIPTSIEIAHMESAISWPGRYLSERPQLLRTVGEVALVKSQFADIARAARRLGLPGRLARRWNEQGLSAIAEGLTRDRVAVF